MFLLLAIIAYCSNAVPSNENHFFVLLASIEDIERGVDFPIETDTPIIEETLNHSLFLRDNISNHTRPTVTIPTSIFKNVALTLTVNNNESIHLDPEATQISLNRGIKSLTTYGRNELVLQYNATYTLHPIRLLSNAHLLTTSVSNHYHLYLFTSPVIVKNNRFIYCYLNDTGAKEYGNWLVKFTLESHQRYNVTVGVCVKDSHNRTEIYYSATLDACVFKVPDPVSLADVGNYTCSLHITHVEIGNKTTHCRDSVPLKLPPSVRSNLLMVILATSIGGAALLVVMAMIVIIIRYFNRHAKNKKDPHELRERQPVLPEPIVQPAEPPAHQPPPNRHNFYLPERDHGYSAGEDSTPDHGHQIRSGSYHYIKRRPKPKIDSVPDSTESDQSQPSRPPNPRGKAVAATAAAESSHADDERSLMFPQRKRSYQREGRRKKRRSADTKPVYP